MTKSPRPVADLLRDEAPHVLAALTRAYGHFDACEDATQEALVKAVRVWTAEGVPERPRGWLVTVASRVLIDALRSDTSRRRREDALYAATPQSELLSRSADAGFDDDERGDRDDSLKLLFLCCHPALSIASQIALTLRAVGGLSTAQIAAAFLVPESTMAQRISRAKATIRADGITFDLPAEDGPERLRAVQHVLYLIFNEGYTATSGEQLTAPDLSQEAIRLTRLLCRAVPEDAESAGLLALMLLTEARRPARTGPGGVLIPLADQDRGRWLADLIEEGTELLSRTLPRGQAGPFQLQAAIAAVHGEASTVDATDWPQILGLYDVLVQVAPSPIARLNRAVAVAMVHGPTAGLAAVEQLRADPKLARGHRLPAVRAHLRELAGDHEGAIEDYRRAAKLTASGPERRYLLDRAAGISSR
ncbi:RNA polymerase sigma factor (sigma-70 family) [Catenulispora sp. EB89]|uniref:RNA polymerase sigma factor n=1 Tax=Catenulispora sp. EB89 TaxID=3156257 RepID=UPI00351813C2